MSNGGYWDKRGNQFEDRWALRQLVLLTSPSSDIESLEREPVGDDEPGVDLWINRKDGTRECHQCKLGNEGKASWSLAALRRTKILEQLQFQISRDPQHRYRLVSGTPAPLFKQLCDEARDSRDAETFWRSQILPVKRLRVAFSEFSAAIGLSTNNPLDQEAAWSLLRKSNWVPFLDDEEQQREMAGQLDSRVDRDPMNALDALASWIRGQVRCRIEIEAVAAYLESRGFKLIRGETDRFGLGVKRLAQKRREQGAGLKFEAELAALQNELGQHSLNRAPVLAGRWRLVRRINVGGFSEIWQGEDITLREREREPVAVKILHATKANDPVLVERFYQGGLVAANITHRMILKILFEPAEADGRHFYVMEYVEGRDLSEWLSKRLLPLPGPQEKVVVPDDPSYGHAAWKILTFVGEALFFLHSTGLVHGDVKPKNILVNPQGAVKLCDFDLVHLQPADGEGSVAIGTWPYLAPEVLACQKATALSDQYSLAMTIVSVIQGSDFLYGQVPMHLPKLLQGLSCSIAVKKNLERALDTEAQNRFESVESFMNNLGSEAFGSGKPVD